MASISIDPSEALRSVIDALGAAALVFSLIGILYTATSAFLLTKFFARTGDIDRNPTLLSILKPLKGQEPRLRENLSSFLAQDTAHSIEMVCGVASSRDPAIGAVDALAGMPQRNVKLAIEPVARGRNPKISNLINMLPMASHGCLIFCDSDIAVGPEYCDTVVSALRDEGIGAVSCLYKGRGDAGFWSVLAAAGQSWQFLPDAVFGVRSGLASPCMGSTIAMDRSTLERIGGLEAFADRLADDHAIGEAVRAAGLEVAIPPMLVTHCNTERSFAELWQRELRWAVTVRGIAPVSYALSFVRMPVALGLLGCMASPAGGLAATAAAIAARLFLVRAVDRAGGGATAPAWLLPLRDLLSFLVYGASFFPGSADWRGSRLRFDHNGVIGAPATQAA